MNSYINRCYFGISFLWWARIGIAIDDISKIEVELERLITKNGVLPLNLAGVTIQTDPWGNPYQFLNFSTVNDNGAKRKDKNLVPLNTDYDLYSKGTDGRSVSPLTAGHSRDEIVRANNGVCRHSRRLLIQLVYVKN